MDFVAARRAHRFEHQAKHHRPQLRQHCYVFDRDGYNKKRRTGRMGRMHELSSVWQDYTGILTTENPVYPMRF